MKASTRAAAALVLAGGLLATTVAPAQAIAGGGVDATGLYADGTRLARFDVNRPENAKKIGDLDNLVGDTKLVGIDRRVQNGRLYGVGDAGGLYVLSTSSANARKVGQLSIALDGTTFGVDFNPTANALRVISNTGQNLRQPFGAEDAPTGATVLDGGLTTTTAVPVLGVTGAAYTNNDLDAATATTLFDIDTTDDQVSIQSPANTGVLNPTGKLGADAGADAGFDIYSNLTKGKTVSNTGYAAINARLWTINLLTGAASDRGKFSKADMSDIAVDLD